MRQVGGSVFGLQVGQAIGALATEVVSGTEIGLPLVGGRGPGAAAGQRGRLRRGLDVPADEVRLYLALREAARSRLFAHVPWLRPYLLGAVEDVRARHHASTPAGSSRRVREADPSDPASMQQALSSGLFEPERHARAAGGAAAAGDRAGAASRAGSRSS